MINNLQNQSKAELIKIIEIQQEEHKNMQAEINGLSVFVDRFKKAVFHFNKTHGDMTPLLTLVVTTPDASLEAHNLTQQAKGVRGYIKHVESVTEMVNQTDINCSEQYIKQLLEQSKEFGNG